MENPEIECLCLRTSILPTYPQYPVHIHLLGTPILFQVFPTVSPHIFSSFFHLYFLTYTIQLRQVLLSYHTAELSCNIVSLDLYTTQSSRLGGSADHIHNTIFWNTRI